MSWWDVKKIKNQNGVSLAEVLVSIGIISILILAIFSLVQYVLMVTAENKFRLGAIMVADQKMERVKNLPYDQVGTLTGMVHGSIPDNETIIENNGIFYVNTLVQYIDDPFDGTLGGSPNDLLPTDYKQVRIRVRWLGKFGQKEVVFYTKIAPRGMETASGGGILSIIVFDANGQPVNLAEVHIENNSLSPVINFDATTNTSGRLDFPGAPESIEGYQIVASKAIYSTDSTTARTLDNPNPTKPPATVLIGQRTEISFAIDRLSNLTIKTIKQDLPTNWQVNTDTTAENQTAPRLAADSTGNIYFVWQDYRSASDSRIYLQKYNLSGQVGWPSGDVIISTANNQIMPDVKVSTTTNIIYVSWNDNSNGNQDGFLEKRSPADGASLWTGRKKIDTNADSADQTYVRLALYNQGSETITTVWQDNRDGNLDIYLQRFNDNKDKLWASEVKVNKNNPDSSDQYEPAIAIDSQDNIYLVWTDKRNGTQDIYAAKYNSSGQPLWANDVKINSNSGTSSRNSPAVAIDNDDNIYFSWTDERNGNADIYLAKYDSNGQPLWTPDNLQVNAYANYNQSFPSLAIDTSNNIYLSWTDERNGNQDIFAQKIDSNGNRLWAADMRVNINLGPSSQSSSNIIINPANNKAYATWQDDRNGNFDIFTSPVENYGAITNIANVSLVINGAKLIGNDPIIYKYKKYFSTDTNGELSLVNIEWDSYNIDLSGPSVYQIVMTSPERPINLAPNTSLEVILYLDD